MAIYSGPTGRRLPYSNLTVEEITEGVSTDPRVISGSTANYLISEAVSTAIASITKESLGLENVDNTSDLNKPISIAVQAALDNKQPLNTYLTQISGLTSDGFLKKVNDIWTLDNSIYEPANTNIQAHIADTTIHVTAEDKERWNLGGSIGITVEGTGNAVTDVTVGANNALTVKKLANFAILDETGKIIPSQLPSYVDDIIEGYYNDISFFQDSAYTIPITPEGSKIYIDLSNNKSYRWSGSAYVEISKSLALGETSSTAYRGDRGKIAYDHSQIIGDVHITPTERENWNSANTNNHTHSNKSIIDQLSQANLDVLALLSIDNGKLKINADTYSTGEISAYGAGTGGGGGSSYNRLDSWSDYSDDKAGWVLSALLGNDLNFRLSNVELGSATNISISGSGNAITNVSKSGNTLIFSKDVSFAPLTHTHNFSDITSKPTTLAGYGITDGVTTNVLNTHINDNVQHITSSEHNYLINLISWFKLDVDGNLYTEKNFYSTNEISAFGVGDGTGGGGTTYNRLDSWADYTSDKAGWVLSALLGNDLNNRVLSLEGGSLLNISTTGIGNAITSVSKSGNSLIFTKGLSFALESHTHSNYLSTSLKGAVNGLAELDANGFVPSSQLPSYVDDVLEFSNLASFPATGTTGKIYVALNTNLTYRWSGSAYIEISASLALGETSSTAYRGDRGKIAYDHSQIAGGVHVTSTERTNWNLAYTNNHTHSNKTIIDQISQSNLDVLALLSIDNGKLKINADTYSTGEISAYGAGTGGGSASYNRLDAWADYTSDKAGWVLSALLGNDLNSRVTSLEGGSATSISVTGAGNAVTSISKSGTTITATKGSTFSLDGHTHSFDSLTSKPTTLTGYGISASDSLLTSNFQAKDNDLTAIAALTGTGFLKRTGTDTWSLDNTSYLPLSGGTITGSLGINFESGVTSGIGSYSIKGVGSNNVIGKGYRIDWDTDFGFFGLVDYGTDRKDVVIANEQEADRFIFMSAGYEKMILDPANGLYIFGNQVWHSGNFNPSSYLPLSGGTITGTVNIKDSSALVFYTSSTNISSVIDVRTDGDGATLHKYRISASGYLPYKENWWDGGNYHSVEMYSDGLKVDSYKVWHQGNDGAGSGLDADLLDGVHNGSLTANFIGYNNSANGYTGVQFMQMSGNNEAGDLPSDTWYSVIKMNHGDGDTYYNRALAFEFFNDGIFTRRRVGGVAFNWRKIAFEDSNVASATKLQTPRTLWGQSFDGTGNVSGALTSVTDITASGTVQSLYGKFTNLSTNYLPKQSSSGLVNSIIYDDGTNIGIGTTSPSYKLDVNGTGRFTGSLTAASLALSGAITGATTGSFSTSVTSPKHDLGNGWAMVANGSEMQMQYNGVTKMRFLSDGSIVATGEVTAYS